MRGVLILLVVLAATVGVCRAGESRDAQNSGRERVVLPSAVVRSVLYDREAKRLWILFPGNTVYAYESVPEARFAALITAESAGAYFQTHIRNQYAARRVVTEVAAHRSGGKRN